MQSARVITLRCLFTELFPIEKCYKFCPQHNSTTPRGIDLNLHGKIDGNGEKWGVTGNTAASARGTAMCHGPCSTLVLFCFKLK